MSSRPIFLGLVFQIAISSCALCWPRAAAADPGDIVTLPINVTWTIVSCDNGSSNPDGCSGQVGGTGLMVENFQFDPDTMSTVQPMINCEDGFPSPGCSDLFDLILSSVSIEVPSVGPDIYNLSFNVIGPRPGGGFSISYYANSWQPVPDSASGAVSVDFPCNAGPGGVEFCTQNWQVTTPEPSSLLLLGTGLLALVPFIRYPFR